MSAACRAVHGPRGAPQGLPAPSSVSLALMFPLVAREKRKILTLPRSRPPFPAPRHSFGQPSDVYSVIDILAFAAAQEISSVARKTGLRRDKQAVLNLYSCCLLSQRLHPQLRVTSSNSTLSLQPVPAVRRVLPPPRLARRNNWCGGARNAPQTNHHHRRRACCLGL